MAKYILVYINKKGRIAHWGGIPRGQKQLITCNGPITTLLSIINIIIPILFDVYMYNQMEPVPVLF